MSGLNTLTRQANPVTCPGVIARRRWWPTSADAAGDPKCKPDNLPTIKTIVDRSDNSPTRCWATIGLSNNACETLAPAERNFIDAINCLSPAQSDLRLLLGIRLPFQGIARGVKGACLWANRCPLGCSPSSFVLVRRRTPIRRVADWVNPRRSETAEGCPISFDQADGSSYRAPFLVTDNVLIPYQPLPFTEVDAPSTLQFLFNGLRNGTTSDGGQRSCTGQMVIKVSVFAVAALLVRRSWWRLPVWSTITTPLHRRVAASAGQKVASPVCRSVQ